MTEGVAEGLKWLLGLQNSDGGIPTFCRGWGTLPFDRSSPDLTAHAIRAWLDKSLAAFPVTQHLITNIDVRIDGDRATSRAMVYNPMGAATREGPLHLFFMGGRYDDELVRTRDGWRIAKRVETPLWFEGSLPKELIVPDQ